MQLLLLGSVASCVALAEAGRACKYVCVCVLFVRVCLALLMCPLSHLHKQTQVATTQAHTGRSSQPHSLRRTHNQPASSRADNPTETCKHRSLKPSRSPLSITLGPCQPTQHSVTLPTLALPWATLSEVRDQFNPHLQVQCRYFNTINAMQYTLEVLEGQYYLMATLM